MMLAVEVEPKRFCTGSQSWETRADVSAFPRLAREFTQGELFCRVAGSTDARGTMRLHVRVEGVSTLRCQRCLGDLPHTLAIDSVVMLARDAAELERLEADPDCDVIPLENRLDLVALIEDEVLLGLPLAAMHAEGECSHGDARFF
ncbi:MAG: YceD family protein [Thiobacillus sp.]|nr:YceD family protein [Thiobacillus sp.]